MQAALLDSEAADDAIPHYRGVTRVGNDCWEARMNENGERVSLGFCDTAAEAARLYDRSARKHPGWPLNFPEEEAERLDERLRRGGRARRCLARSDENGTDDDDGRVHDGRRRGDPSRVDDVG